MRPEAELLLESYDAFKAAAGEDAKRLWEIYQSRLEDVLARTPGLSRERMQAIVNIAYQRWLKANTRPSTIPPKA
ncbi:MAG TPA: hypothetical protein VLT36_02350 [Candidatus Dormibacteraeota bacterium]|nr:hypothetical protein [Candidatus Dormibacteraeota bacterium]